MSSQGLSEIARQVLRGEREYVASHVGRSQYSAGGMSSCGLAALNCARIVLHRERIIPKKTDLVKSLMQQETCEEVLGICLQWPNSAHLDVEELHSAPIFAQTLTLAWSDYDKPGSSQFKALLRRLEQSTSYSAALVITRPPEIICLLKLYTGAHTKPLYVTFDSHPRTKHPSGAAFIFHPSLKAAAYYLSDLLQYDPHLLSDPGLQWQAQLLAHYSAHAFIAREEISTAEKERMLIDTSLELLNLKTEVVELREKNRGLESDANSLVEENGKLEAKVEDLEDTNLQLRRRIEAFMSESLPSGAAAQSHAPLGSRSTLAILPESPSRPPVSWGSSVSSSPRVSAVASSSSKGKQVLRSFSNDMDEDDEHFASRVQYEWQTEVERGSNNNMAIVLQAQKQFDDEDRLLRMQMERLMEYTQKVFECGICMESLPDDVVAQIESCSHKFCRQCLLRYLQSKLVDHRFPILCPTCSAEQSNSNAGTISSAIALQIGLNEQEYAVFTELELSSFSVLLHCRQCRQAVFVDKSEYEAQDIVACPLPKCTHAWCKACSRSIDFAGPKHSCDGTSELHHLMDQQGWKNCPGCRTPTSKIEGCNHMTCIAPGCNMHFCYLCGESIVQSIRRQDIRSALERHYARCRMIDG